MLKKYIPEPAAPVIAQWVVQYDFKLKIKKERQSKLGDYRSPYNGSNHHITVNHNLNQYAFLITLVHEVAHLTTYNKYKDRVMPHGAEWKQEYKDLMRPFMNAEIFPTDILLALQKHFINPSASSCTDDHLLRVLKRYDARKEGTNLVFVEKLPHKSVFRSMKGKLFEKGERIRTRYLCREIPQGHIYYFHPLAEVEPVPPKAE